MSNIDINNLSKEEAEALLAKVLNDRKSDTGTVEVITAEQDQVAQTINSGMASKINQAAETQAPAVAQIQQLDLTSSKLNLRDLGLTDADAKEVMELKNKLGPMDALAVAEYGKDISSGTNNCTSEILGLVHNKDLDETGAKLNELVHVAKGINSSNFIGKQSSFARLPVIGGLFKSVEKARTNFLEKFNTTEQQIGSLITEIEKNQTGLTSRVHTLDRMFENVNNDYRSLGLHIAAGHLKLQDLKQEIVELSAGNKQDQNVIQRIYDLNHVVNNLEKRLHDLHVLQQSALQTLPMIRIIQANNLMLVDKFYAIKNITIQALLNQKSQVQTQADAQQAQIQNDFTSAADAFLDRPENKDVFVAGSPELTALDQQIQILSQTLPPTTTYAELFDKARSVVATYMNLPSAGGEAQQPQKANVPQPTIPPNLGQMQAVVNNSVDDKFAHIDKLSGLDYDRALERLSDAELTEYMQKV
jgi:uncharacterized protein YaaN involved in tellurite resistance